MDKHPGRSESSRSQVSVDSFITEENPAAVPAGEAEQQAHLTALDGKKSLFVTLDLCRAVFHPQRGSVWTICRVAAPSVTQLVVRLQHLPAHFSVGLKSSV